MKKETNKGLTENGALTLKSSESHVLDLFSMGGALRNRDKEEVKQMISLALGEDRDLAIKCLFYLRDVRGGQGERQTFREGLSVLSNYYPDEAKKLLPLIEEYGRWDDIFYLENISIENFIREQLILDIKSERPSLLAKWMPSENTSSKKTIELARKMRKYLGMSSKNYRIMLRNLRNKINLVETKLSSNKISDIEYSSVPSKAQLKYKKAFANKDEVRYSKYLEDVKEGKEKINASVLFPYEIVREAKKEDNETLEALWKNLPDYTNNNEKAIVVADTSGSMSWSNNALALDVALSLAMYFGERNEGVFKDKFITFSERPQLQEISGNTLNQKYRNLSRADWGGSTNIQGVFDLLLNTAVLNNLSKSDMPSTIYIVSDMEFDMCTRGFTNFENIKEKYTNAEYEMPTLVFWNVNSRNNNVPVDKNEKGVILVSGCSPSIFKMATEKTTPELFMIKTLNSKRYDAISQVLNG